MMEARFDDMENQMMNVQAALEGNSQSGLFKQPTFTGMRNEDINQWLAKFERLAKFYNWNEAKKLNALIFNLGGPALAWFETLPEEEKNNLNAVVLGLKNRFGATNLEFIFRQELNARKQGSTESLMLYTEDIIRKCQRLSLSDKEMMNIFINGLSHELKTHVILNQPTSFAEAENLARLKDAVSLPNASGIFTATNPPQNNERRIKELEGQVNLLISSLATKNKTEPVNLVYHDNPEFQMTDQPKQDLHKMVAALQLENQRLRNNQRPQPQFQEGVRGRNLRTTDGQPICNNCFRVGHISRYCNSRQPQQSPSSFRQPFRSQNQPNFQGDNFRNQPHTQQPNFRNNGYQNNQNSQRFQNRLPHSYLPRGQSNQFPAQRQPFDNQRAQYNLNGMGSSTWGN